MRLVEALADRWGGEHNLGGRRVWFGLDDHIDHNHTDHNRDIGRLGAS